MKNIINRLLVPFYFSAIFLVFISCTDDDSNTTPVLDKSESKNVSYGNHQQQKYDIYLPKERSSKTTKVFILVHGGGWIDGDKNDMDYFIPALQKQSPNYAVVNINYRLASEGNSPFPMQIDDIKGVITDLKAKKEEYQIANEYAFIGVSAGAHLSMLYSYANDSNNEVDMVCSIVGPTNFTDDAYVNPTALTYALLAIQIQRITGVLFSENSQFYKDNSPYHVVTSSAPPTILFYGDKDELIPSSQGKDMKAKLDELGVTNSFTLYSNEGHGWEGESFLDTSEKLSAFINTHF